MRPRSDGLTDRRYVAALTVAGFLLVCTCAPAQTLRISVFGLFHPTELMVSPVAGDALALQACGFTAISDSAATVTLDRERNDVRLLNGGPSESCASITVSGRASGQFFLEVPGKLRRRFQGSMTLTTHASPLESAARAAVTKPRELLAVVSMDLETAVASAVDAESPTGAPPAALEAQAIAARSFYVAKRGRHGEFDFCDTTHCQFLREPPAPGAPAARAATNTRGMVLTYRGAVIPAFYSARCGGRTRALPRELAGGDQYPYYAVECAWCLRHPAEPGAGNVQNYGPASTHELGLCQEGAAAMARAGARAEQILAHYYPNTAMVRMGEVNAR